MAQEIRNIQFSSEKPRQSRFPVEASVTVRPGYLAGVYDAKGTTKQGQVREYNDGVTGLRYAGFINGDAILEGSGGTTYYVEVDIQGLQIKRCPVTGSASAKPQTLVYANGPDPNADLSLTPATAGQEPVGELHEQTAASSTNWQVKFFPSFLVQKNEQTLKIGPVTAYTADGAITLPTVDGEAARLTGASSAAMTLAAPGIAQLGFVFTIYRSAGSGTHDVDFTDEAGNAHTKVFASGTTGGLPLRLLAVSTTGWRPLAG